MTDAANQHYRIMGMLDDSVSVERRPSDGQVWLRIESSDGDRSGVIALDAEEAWSLARALIEGPESLSGEAAS